jgi:hypothetical protein
LLWAGHTKGAHRLFVGYQGQGALAAKGHAKEIGNGKKVHDVR